MRKYIIIKFFLLSYLGFTQHSMLFQNPKNPEVFLFEKYGNVPISNYNGKPNISIPLHTIQHGDINIKLDLSYSSNGIRVDEESSSIGLGWYFSTGMITQNIQDKDDLKPGRILKQPQYLWASSIGYPIFPNPNWHVNTLNYVYNNLPNNSLSRVVRSVSTPTLDKYFITKLRSESYLDNNQYAVYYDTNMENYGEALNIWYDNTDLSIDTFNASFFGHNLTFIIDGTNIKVLNKRGYKIEKSVISDPITPKFTWKITSPSGIMYFFSEQLISTYSPSLIQSYSTYQDLESQGTGYKTFTSSSQPVAPIGFLNSYSRMWKITKIVDTKNNEINFNYETLPSINSRAGTSCETHFLNIDQISLEPRNIGLWHEVVTNLNYDGPTLYTPGPGGNNKISITQIGKYLLGSSSYGQSIHQQKSILKEITYSDKKLELINSDRIDIPFDKKQTSLNVWYKNTVIKTIHFNHSYFNPFHTDNTQKRLKLDSITIGDQVYSFIYNSTQLPNKDSNSFDYWGYYNGMPNTNSINNPFRLYKNSNSIPQWAKYFIPLIEGTANRSAHPIYCQAGILEKIIYPSGGSSELFYELNEFDNYFFPDYDNKVGLDTSNNYTNDYMQANSKGYGLRIKKIVNKNNDIIINTKKYTYNGGKHIPAYVGYNDIDYFRGVSNEYLGINVLQYQKRAFSGLKITSFSNSIYQSGIYGNGDYVGYDSVVVEDLDTSGNNNGKTIDYFTNIPDVSGRTKFSGGGAIGPYSALAAYYCDYFGQSIRNTDIENGLLIKTKIFDKDSNLKQEIENGYSTQVLSNTSKYNIKAVTLPGSYGYYYDASPGYFQPTIIEAIFNEYIFLYYPLKFSNSILVNKKNTEFFQSGNKETKTYYNYNSNNIPTGKTLNDVNGNTIYSESTYMMSTSDLINKNILNLPLNTTILENGAIKKQFSYQYQDVNNVTLLNKLEELPSGNSDPSIKISTFYDLYDDKNNLIQFHRENDIYTSVIWGYNKTLIVAKIENAQYSQIQSSLIQAVQSASDTGTEAQLQIALDNLRNSLPDAMVTTYTHKPLVGISCITDSKGDKIMYYYDSNNRLEFVKDKDGNILNEYDYHFRPQN